MCHSSVPATCKARPRPDFEHTCGGRREMRLAVCDVAVLRFAACGLWADRRGKGDLPLHARSKLAAGRQKRQLVQPTSNGMPGFWVKGRAFVSCRRMYLVRCDDLAETPERRQAKGHGACSDPDCRVQHANHIRLGQNTAN